MADELRGSTRMAEARLPFDIVFLGSSQSLWSVLPGNIANGLAGAERTFEDRFTTAFLPVHQDKNKGDVASGLLDCVDRLQG